MRALRGAQGPRRTGWDVGSTAGGSNYYQSGNLGNVLTTTVYSLPADGSQIYVPLWSPVGGQRYYNEYNYTSGP